MAMEGFMIGTQGSVGMCLRIPSHAERDGSLLHAFLRGVGEYIRMFTHE